MTGLIDLHGQPLRRELLTREVAGPTLAGVRSPISGYPADGMNPVRLANILRAADQGDPLRYFELAELIEERDLHYLGVLGTRTAGAPTALNTLDELAAALGDDENFAATVTAALGNRVRTDTAAQGLDSTQKANARTNIDAYGSVEIGNPDTNFVTTFNSGLS